jgi:hypothetical protein
MGFLDRLLGRSKKAAGAVREAAEDVFERDKRDEDQKVATEPPRGSETGLTPPSPPPAPGGTPPAGGVGSTGPGGGNPPSPAA